MISDELPQLSFFRPSGPSVDPPLARSIPSAPKCVALLRARRRLLSSSSVIFGSAFDCVCLRRCVAKVKTKNWTSGKESRQKPSKIIYSSDLLYKILLQAFFDCWIPFLVSGKDTLDDPDGLPRAALVALST